MKKILVPSEKAKLISASLGEESMHINACICVQNNYKMRKVEEVPSIVASLEWFES